MHQCAHKDFQREPTIAPLSREESQTHRHHMSAQSQTTWHNLRIRFDYGYADNPQNDKDKDGFALACSSIGQSIKVSSTQNLTCLAEDLMTTQTLSELKSYGTAMADRFSKALKAEDLGGTPTPSITYGANNGQSCEVVFPGATENTDFVVFVTTRPLRHKGTTLAFAASCQLHATTNRPIVGHMNVAPKTLQTNDDLATVLLHELSHALGWSPVMFPRFRHPNNRSLTYRQYDGTMYPTGPVKGDGANQVAPDTMSVDHTQLGPGKKLEFVTPRLLTEARKYFDCPTLAGVEIENGGGTSSDTASHWEKRILYYELMGAAQNLRAGSFSVFSLALFDDMGFYKADLSQADPMTWGYGMGCSFVQNDCNQWPSTYFCRAMPNNGTAIAGCGYDRTFSGACQLNTYTTDLPVGYRHFINPREAGSDIYADRCPIWGQYETVGTGSGNCLDPTNTPVEAQNTFGARTGPNSRCFMTQTVKPGVGVTSYTPRCNVVVCETDPSMIAAGTAAHILIGNSFHRCSDNKIFQLLYPPNSQIQGPAPAQGVESIVSYDRTGLFDCGPNVSYMCSETAQNLERNRAPLLNTTADQWSRISSVSPTYTSEKGGALITIMGSGLTRCGRVDFGGISATNVTVFSDTMMTVTTSKLEDGKGPLKTSDNKLVNVDLWCSSQTACKHGIFLAGSSSPVKYCQMGQLINGFNYTDKGQNGIDLGAALGDVKNFLEEFLATTIGKIVGAVVGVVIFIAIVCALKSCLCGKDNKAEEEAKRRSQHKMQPVRHQQQPQQPTGYYRRDEYEDELL